MKNFCNEVQRGGRRTESLGIGEDDWRREIEESMSRSAWCNTGQSWPHSRHSKIEPYR